MCKTIFSEAFAFQTSEPYLFFQSVSLCFILHPELNNILSEGLSGSQ